MNPASALQAVIFDCDGILVDTEPLHYQAFQEVLRPLGLGFDYEEYTRHYIGFDDRDAFIEAFKAGGRELDAAALAGYMHAKAWALQEIVSRGIRSFPGVVELVRELASGGVPLAVASGALRHEVEDFLTALSLRDVFPIIVAADEVTHSKPDPETYLLALQRLEESLGKHLEARACIAIEDTPAGIAAAKGARLMVIGVTNSFPAENLSGADRVLPGLDHIDLAGLGRLVEEVVRKG